MSINRVNISGNLTRDPEQRATQGGTSITTFGIAVNDRRKDPQSGEWKDYPNFIDCVVFGNRADALAKLLTKGMKVAVEGKLRWSQWEKDGQKRSKIEVIVDEVEFLSGSKAQNQPQQPQQANYSQNGNSAPNSAAMGPQGGYYQQQQPPATNGYDDLYAEPIPF